MLDIYKESFEAVVQSDTAKMIELIVRLEDEYDQGGPGNNENVGKLLILTGHYEEGLEVLNKNIAGNEQTTNAFYYIRSLYYIGIANEALGYFPEAITNYEEILKFWNSADIELDMISDTRKRLARLSS